MISEIFDACVQLLIAMAEVLGTTYKAINVWIFVVIWPLLTIGLLLIIFLQRRKIRKLQQRGQAKPLPGLSGLG